MSGPGPNIPWFNDLLEKTGNSLPGTPVISLAASAEDTNVVTITVSVEPLNGVVPANIPCLAWVGEDLATAPTNMDSIVPDGLVLSALGDMVLALFADGDEVALTITTALVGSFYLMPLSSGEIFSVAVTFAGP